VGEARGLNVAARLVSEIRRGDGVAKRAASEAK